jgi:excinuclease ABC subunit C
MDAAASKMDFEEAHLYKEKIQSLEMYQSKSMVVNPKLNNIDVITIFSDEQTAYVNYMQIKSGTIFLTSTVELKRKLENQEDAEMLIYAFINLKEKYQSEASEILTNINVKDQFENFAFVQPKIGDKKKLVALSEKNILHYKKEKVSQNEHVPSYFRVLRTLQNDLKLKELPRHIECFDNSNIQGSSPVASMVCFINAKAAKKEYRHFHIKTVEGANDFASMAEITYRRYSKLLNEKLPLPNLIVIDGGKGQLSAAVESLQKLDLTDKIPVIGIAKRLEEIYVPNDPYPLHISKKSEALKLLQQLRDEAHRFAVTFHRDVRSKKSLVSVFDEIKGIGSETIDKLLSHYKSVKKISEASEAALSKIIGTQKAAIIFTALQQKREA